GPPDILMLTVTNLRKSFGAQAAVAGVSFEIGAGQIVGLLGPNGAGKTTTVSMIAGLVAPDAGDVLIDGRRLAGDTDPSSGASVWCRRTSRSTASCRPSTTSGCSAPFTDSRGAGSTGRSRPDWRSSASPSAAATASGRSAAA
ncbi:MAG: ATP-binding cassette domain-containing protein, partial [Acidobacteriota bacterium]|nr:ATP-binding cassette domain-containing protein [Acidobacteriota bacterium]